MFYLFGLRNGCYVEPPVCQNLFICDADIDTAPVAHHSSLPLLGQGSHFRIARQLLRREALMQHPPRKNMAMENPSFQWANHQIKEIPLPDCVTRAWSSVLSCFIVFMPECSAYTEVLKVWTPPKNVSHWRFLLPFPALPCITSFGPSPDLNKPWINEG